MIQTAFLPPFLSCVYYDQPPTHSHRQVNQNPTALPFRFLSALQGSIRPVDLDTASAAQTMGTRLLPGAFFRYCPSMQGRAHFLEPRRGDHRLQSVLHLPIAEKRHHGGLHILCTEMLGDGPQQRDEAPNAEPHLPMGGYYLLHSGRE